VNLRLYLVRQGYIYLGTIWIMIRDLHSATSLELWVDLCVNSIVFRSPDRIMLCILECTGDQHTILAQMALDFLSIPAILIWLWFSCVLTLGLRRNTPKDREDTCNWEWAIVSIIVILSDFLVSFSLSFLCLFPRVFMYLTSTTIQSSFTYPNEEALRLFLLVAATSYSVGTDKNYENYNTY
jgi:hypothetical protein